MRVLGFIFLSLLFASAVVCVDYFLPGDYLIKFLNEQFVEVFATLVGFNIAAVIFLIGQLIVLEEGHNFIFENTRREVKHNSYFLLAAFVISLLLLIFRPDFTEAAPFPVKLGFYIINILILTLFTLATFALYEILHATFLLNKKR